MSDAAPARPADGEAAFTVSSSRNFVSWLAASGTSLVVTTYQSGKVFLIGSNPDTGRLSITERSLERPMGAAVTGRRLAVAGLTQITTFVDAAAGQTRDGYDAWFVPQTASFTGDVDAHDLAFLDDGRVLFVNTLFSCLATTSDTHSFKPLWRPPFVSRLAAEDRCHLNGLAMRDGRPAWVTCIAESDVADGWRDRRRDGGVIVDVATGAIACRGLAMPHSPRWHAGSLWVLNSGGGEFGRVDLAAGRFEPIAFCPGYLRGLTFVDRFAVIGLSQARENRTFSGLPLEDRLVDAKVAARCGLYVIDTTNGDVAHWLRIEGVVRELYDVVALPGVRRPYLVGFRKDEIRRTVSIEE